MHALAVWGIRNEREQDRLIEKQQNSWTDEFVFVFVEGRVVFSILVVNKERGKLLRNLSVCILTTSIRSRIGKH